MKTFVFRWLAAMALSVGFAVGAVAQAKAAELRIGMDGAISSIDPLYHNNGNNLMVSAHIFDPLVDRDEKGELIPGLAQSWQLVNDRLWEFKLRPGVRFHDGAPLTTGDIKFSLQRPPKVPNSPSSYVGYVRSIERIIQVDELTLQIETEAPDPELPRDLSYVYIQSKKAAEGKTTDDFNKGVAAVGTGPFKFVEYIPGRQIVLARNDDYWRGVSNWEKVTILPIKNSAARLAALLTGDVDVASGIPTVDLPKLRQNPKIAIVSGPQNRVFYLQVDHRDQSPMTFDNDGNVLAKNPLQDLRVRQAMSKAINRELLIDRLLEGQGTPAGEAIPPGFRGSNPKLIADAYDPEGAKKLLTDAGFPDGFRLILHGANDRYAFDESMPQAIAQMFSRIGIKSEIELSPNSLFRKRGKAGELSLQFGGWGNSSAVSMLVAVMHSPDKEKGFGSSNRGRYSNSEFDEFLEQTLATMNPEERLASIRKATEMAMKDLAVIPLFWTEFAWGMRNDLLMKPNSRGLTFAKDVKPN
ncbi:ABC transporter substrate-binding protein [Pelagibius litoralis]|uniref:ABC transporter substrate-binding protein n=1 Tax=Pelagibius litoralis TaxID=374515 RepID=A0A967KCN2_9PROT|nr:ABC transporter substrate-binding protein [Pelagibius litoralis]NIA70964.1 ABC transporter substrate-binding protein [Pelagibius litoralis]